MAPVYFYIPAESLEDVIDCGLKLSEWKTKTTATPWNSMVRPCLSTLLHPRDDKRNKDAGFQCIKLEVPATDLIVADSDLYYVSRIHPGLERNYLHSMVPLKDYQFGTYRKPECLVFSTIMSDQISIFGKGMDEPLLYENSESLYVNSLLERFNDRYDEGNQVLLYSLLAMQELNGNIQGYFSEENGLAVFLDTERNQHFSVPIPNYHQYRLNPDEDEMRPASKGGD